jgi:hypothetical protein
MCSQTLTTFMCNHETGTMSAEQEDARVHALVCDPDRVGWRGNTTQWAKRAGNMLDGGELRHENMKKIANCVRDIRLLRPDNAVHCPLHIQSTWDALYADTCHVVVTTKTTDMSLINWLGILAYYVRHHPQMGIKRAHQIVSPGWGAMSVALTDGAWGVGRDGAVVCAKTDCLRTRTILVLLGATVRMGVHSDDTMGVHAVQWLSGRPKAHFCDRLLEYFCDAPTMIALSHQRHGPPPCAALRLPHQAITGTTNHDNDILGSHSLRFFRDT